MYPLYLHDITGDAAPGDFFISTTYFVIDEEQPVYIMGRDGDFKINDGKISRHHAQFILQPDGLFFRDLKSTNGTRVNGTKLLPTRKLKLEVGDIIKIGKKRWLLSTQKEFDPKWLPKPYIEVFKPPEQEAKAFINVEAAKKHYRNVLNGPFPDGQLLVLLDQSNSGHAYKLIVEKNVELVKLKAK